MKMYSVNHDDYYVQTNNDGIVKTFNRMCLGLLVTTIISYLSYSSGLYMRFLYGSSYAILAIVEIAVVLLFSFMYRKLSPAAVTFLFYLYACINQSFKNKAQRYFHVE